MIPRTLVDPTAFWTMIAAGVTFSLAIIAWYQLHGLSKTSRGDFIHKFKEDFFTEKTRELFALIENGCIQFRSTMFRNDSDASFLVVASSIPPSLRKPRPPKKFSSYEVDDLLLGHFEDLGLYEQKGIVGIEMVYELFDTYIEISWKNKEIHRYIEFCQQEEHENDIYDKFEYIYGKCKSFGEAKRKWTNRACVIRWVLKSWWRLHWWAGVRT